MFDTVLIEKTLKKMGIKKEFKPDLISYVTVDSRKAAEKSMFFAFEGKTNNGHDYIGELLEKNVYCVGSQGNHSSEKFIKVPDVLEFMHLLAKERRKLFKGKVIALTGSSGKTSTREFLGTLLSLLGKTTYSSYANYNNHIGLPLVIMNLPMNIDYMILELGMNHGGEIKLLTEIADPDFSFITNIGTAHIGNFNSLEELADAKLELFDNTNGIIIADISNKFIQMWLERNPDRKISEYNQKVFAESYNTFEKYPDYMIDNLLTAAEVTKVVSGKVPDLEKGLERYKIPSMRGEIKTIGKRKFVVDCYNANPDSMSRSIAEFYKKSVAEKEEDIYLILGSMFELGVFSKKMHQELVNYLKTLKLLKRAFLTGTEFEKIKECFLNEKNIIFIGNVEDVVPLLPESGLFFVKGSRGNELEKIFEFIEQK